MPRFSSPFSSLIEAARAEAVRRHREAGPQADPAASTGGRLRDLQLDTFATGRAPRGLTGRRDASWLVSVAAHSVGLGAVLVVPLFLPEALPEATVAVKAFFVEPSSVAAPPPPPPPSRGPVARSKAPSTPPAPSAFTAPIEVPAEVQPEAGIDLGVEGGVAGGVEGGVPGGVVGGVVGGLPDAPQGPVAPVRVGGLLKEPRKLRHVDPEYPMLALKARMQGVVVVEAVIDARGAVTEAKILRGVPMLDEAALAAVRQWTYQPTLLDGIPTPVIMTVTVQFRLNQGNG